ncbi:hypothetical protein D3C80_1941440 [compost metagenome]
MDALALSFDDWPVRGALENNGIQIIVVGNKAPAGIVDGIAHIPRGIFAGVLATHLDGHSLAASPQQKVKVCIHMVCCRALKVAPQRP